MLARPSRPSRRRRTSTTSRPGTETIGKQIWTGVCATCHGNLGQGGYGPAIATNSLLIQPGALAGIVRNGFVGRDGRDAAGRRHLDTGEINALVAYVKKNIYKSAPAGGTTSGG